MERWHGFETARKVVRVHETTIADSGSHLSAHFVTVPSRSLGGDSYLFRGSQGPLEALGLSRIADIPLGGVARSLAACLVSETVEEFLRRFDAGFEEETRLSGTDLPRHFTFAEYLTFARVVPFGWRSPPVDSLGTDSLGNILTAQGHGNAGYVYHEASNAPVLAVAIPAGIVIRGSSPALAKALDSGLRGRLLELAKNLSAEAHPSGENR